MFSRGIRSRSKAAVEFPEGAEWLNVDRPLTMADVRGKVVLLDFWTYCCINCMHVIPDLKRLEEEFPELVVVGVHSAKFANEQVRDNIRHAVLRYEVEHPVVIDSDFVLWRAYGIHAWPSFVLVDPVGNVAGKASGEGAYEMFATSIRSLVEAFEGVVDHEPFRLAPERDRAPRSALAYPGKLEVDREGRRLFLSDSNHNRIVVFLPDGEITQVIGSGAEGSRDGPSEEAEFFRPQGLAYDPRDDSLYVADTENHLIRRVDLRAGTVGTVLGTGHQGGHAIRGRGTGQAISSPWDLAIMGDHLYIAMAGPHQLWRMDLRTHEAERYAGSGREDIVDGPRERAALAQPSGIDTDGQRILFADSEVSAVRMVEGDAVHTLVGAGLFDFGDVDGPLGRARLQHPLGVLWKEGTVLVADTYNHKVKLIDIEGGSVHTLVGTGESGLADGPGREARLSEPSDIALLDGMMYVVDSNNHLVRVFDPAGDRLRTFRFTNEEVLFPKPARSFQGTRVELEPVRLAQGDASIRLRLLPPDGHVWNAEAPNHLEVISEGQVKAMPFKPPDWSFDYQLPVQVEGEGSLRAQVVAYFCEAEASELCRFMALDIRVPVAPDEGAAGEAEAVHRLELA